MADVAHGRLPESAAPIWSGQVGGEPIADEVRELVERAHLAVYEGRNDEAEMLMYRVLEYGMFPTILNNLALFQLERHNRPDEALRLLNQALEGEPDVCQPFTRSVAARCLLRLGRRREARRCLDRAVKDFEIGRKQLAGSPEDLRGWREYISKILEAAGELGDDELVWKLYRRWSREIVLVSSHHWGGVAAFNLKRFRAAAKAWSHTAGEDRPFLRMYETVATWCERGLIEPFPMDYDAMGPDPLPRLAAALQGVPPENERRGSVDDGDTELDPEAVMLDYWFRLAVLMSRPANRMMFIWLIFRPLLEPGSKREDRPAYLSGVRDLVAAGDEWGLALARRLFFSREVPADMKEAAAQGLIETGRLSPDAPVRMWLNGKVREVPFIAGEMRVADDG